MECDASQILSFVMIVDDCNNQVVTETVCLYIDHNCATYKKFKEMQQCKVMMMRSVD